MEVNLSPELEAALSESARKQGVAPEALALQALRERFLGSVEVPPLMEGDQPIQANGPMKVILPEPRDEWERKLREFASDCGVSLSDSAVSREGIYE